ncbi:MAG: hypothetical protein KBT02_02695 [Treponema sp.]|nr:hypothetical protein [Candidatus Treponema caballi]
MKKLVFIIVLTLIAACLFAQVGNNTFNTSSWKMLDNAQRAYDEGDVMKAMKLAENARQARIEEFTNAASTMETALIPTAVQRRGDLIPDVRKIWEERKESQAIAILDNALLLHTEEDFNNSITAVCEWYRSRIAYPEAEYLLGKLYMLEGEYDIASDFFRQAIDHSDVLDIQDEKISILYDSAYLDELRNDMNGFEEKLLQIMEYNPDYVEYITSRSSNSYLDAIIRATRRNFTPDKFFLLYRSEYYDTISACIDLASYYSEMGYNDKAFPVSVLAVLTSFTRIYSILKSRNVKYVYTTVEGFFDEAAKHSDVQKWMKDNKVWNSFYVFGKLVLDYQRNESMAKDIFIILNEKCPDSYVKNAASTMLSTME